MRAITAVSLLGKVSTNFTHLDWEICAVLSLCQTSLFFFIFGPKVPFQFCQTTKLFAILLQNLWSVFLFLHSTNRTQGGLFLSNGFLLATQPYRRDLWSAWDIGITCIQRPFLVIKACSSFKVTIGLLMASSDPSPPCLIIQFRGMA